MPLKIEINPSTENKTAYVKISGPMNEDLGIELTTLFDIKGKVFIIDMAGIDYINSIGVRAWVNFIRNFSQGREITFIRCSSDVVDQLNMVPAFLGGSRVQSFFGPFTCPKCTTEKSCLFEGELNIPRLKEKCSTIMCEDCEEQMNFDEDPADYFGFIRYPGVV